MDRWIFVINFNFTYGLDRWIFVIILLLLLFGYNIIIYTFNDFHEDFPTAGEASGKMINDFHNDFLPAREAGGKNPKNTITTTPTA